VRARFGLGTISDVSPPCAPKRTSASPSSLAKSIGLPAALRSAASAARNRAEIAAPMRRVSIRFQFGPKICPRLKSLWRRIRLGSIRLLELGSWPWDKHIYHRASKHAVMDRRLGATKLPATSTRTTLSRCLRRMPGFEALWLSYQKSFSETSWIEGDGLQDGLSLAKPIALPRDLTAVSENGRRRPRHRRRRDLPVFGTHDDLHSDDRRAVEQAVGRPRPVGSRTLKLRYPILSTLPRLPGWLREGWPAGRIPGLPRRQRWHRASLQSNGYGNIWGS
jgi:hypothetical protein